MTVFVYFDDGTEEFFPEASAASLRGSTVVICRWDPTRKGLDDLKSFDANAGVAAIEVTRGGIIVERIVPPKPASPQDPPTR